LIRAPSPPAWGR